MKNRINFTQSKSNKDFVVQSIDVNFSYEMTGKSLGPVTDVFKRRQKHSVKSKNTGVLKNLLLPCLHNIIETGQILLLQDKRRLTNRDLTV